MGLKHLTALTRDVQVSDGESFAVRGLSIEDLVVVVEQHQAELTPLFNQVQAGEVSLTDTSVLATLLFKQAPRAAAHVIARAEDPLADEQDVVAAKGLPFPVQLDALEKIAELTFKSAAPKKVGEMVIRMLMGVTVAIRDLKPSLNGFGDSVGR